MTEQNYKEEDFIKWLDDRFGGVKIIDGKEHYIVHRDQSRTTYIAVEFPRGNRNDTETNFWRRQYLQSQYRKAITANGEGDAKNHCNQARK